MSGKRRPRRIPIVTLIMREVRENDKHILHNEWNRDRRHQGAIKKLRQSIQDLHGQANIIAPREELFELLSNLATQTWLPSDKFMDLTFTLCEEAATIHFTAFLSQDPDQFVEQQIVKLKRNYA